MYKLYDREINKGYSNWRRITFRFSITVDPTFGSSQ